MRLTILERYRLEILLALRRRPPTWRRFVPRAAAGIAIWSGLVFVLIWLLRRDGGDARLSDFLTGAASYSIFMMTILLVRASFRWRLTEAIIDWRRVEELRGSAAQKGE